LPPSPIGALVTKNVMGCRGAGVCCASNKQEASKEGAVNATIKDRVFDIRPSSRKRRGDRSRLQAPSPGGRLAQEACAGKRVSLPAQQTDSSGRCCRQSASGLEKLDASFGDKGVESN
jgi:hypothetical protein